MSLYGFVFTINTMFIQKKNPMLLVLSGSFQTYKTDSEISTENNAFAGI